MHTQYIQLKLVGICVRFEWIWLKGVPIRLVGIFWWSTLGKRQGGFTSNTPLPVAILLMDLLSFCLYLYVPLRCVHNGWVETLHLPVFIEWNCDIAHSSHLFWRKKHGIQFNTYHCNTYLWTSNEYWMHYQVVVLLLFLSVGYLCCFYLHVQKYHCFHSLSVKLKRERHLIRRIDKL